MKFWNDDLRICPRCKQAVSLQGEEKAECPHCRTRVWFFNFRELKSPPELPEPRSEHLLKNPTTSLLLVATVLFALVALVGIFNGLVVAAVCALATIGFAAFGFLRHYEAKRIEDGLRHMNDLRMYGEIVGDRVKELTSRYNSLLRTGNTRIEHYYNQVYRQAEQEREEAEHLRDEARLDRLAVRDVETRIYAMAERLVADHLKWTSNKLRADPENYRRNKQQLSKAFDFVESIGYQLPANLRKEALENLKIQYREKVREHALKEKQREINRQMREEEKLRREREQAVEEARDQERMLEMRLDEALREHRDAHDGEVEDLRRQLAEAHASSERAMSMAQLTRTGHVYILSNIGSFGEGVFKVGMTRRVEPDLRVKELGDASVPFPFDVHAMILCDDAPKLEKQLHHELTQYRVNRVNFRKEYFAAPLDVILDAVKQHHGKVDYVATPEALEFRETQTISDEEVVALERELADVGIEFEEDEED